MVSLAQPTWLSNDPLLAAVAALEKENAWYATAFRVDGEFRVPAAKVPEWMSRLANKNVSETLKSPTVKPWTGRHTVEERFDDMLVAKATIGGSKAWIVTSNRSVGILIEGVSTSTLSNDVQAAQFVNREFERTFLSAAVPAGDLTPIFKETDSNLFVGNLYRRVHLRADDQGRLRPERSAQWDESVRVATNGRSTIFFVYLPAEGGQQGAGDGKHHCYFTSGT
jgi:hypothetical protein